MKKKEILKKQLLTPLDLITLTPFILAVTLGMGIWAFGLTAGVTMATSVILMLISAGIYLNRLLLGWEENYEKIIAEYKEKIRMNRDDELDILYRKLKKDGDPRTEALLKDLRTLTKALINEHTPNAIDIVSDVDRLFKKSVDYLKESLEIWQTAEEMERESIKNELLKQREVLISEVEKSLENLGNVLGSMKKVIINSGRGQQLAELREELNTRLKIAEDVEEKIKSMRSSKISAEEEAKYLHYAE